MVFNMSNLLLMIKFCYWSLGHAFYMPHSRDDCNTRTKCVHNNTYNYTFQENNIQINVLYTYMY